MHHQGMILRNFSPKDPAVLNSYGVVMYYNCSTSLFCGDFLWIFPQTSYFSAVIFLSSTARMGHRDGWYLIAIAVVFLSSTARMGHRDGWYLATTRNRECEMAEEEEKEEVEVEEAEGGGGGD